MSRARTVTEKFYAPRKIYGPNLFKIFADEVGGGPARIAELLHETEETVKSWMVSAEQPPKDAAKVPRSAVLALYWETQYGRGEMHADLINEIQLLHLHIKTLEAKYKKAKEMAEALKSMGTGGSANEPFFEELRDAGYCIPNRHEKAMAWKPGQTFWSKRRAGV